jgi:hypothetical protein
MKKNIKAAIIIGIVLVATAITLSFVLPYFKKPSDTKSQSTHVNIYVNSSISFNITSEITQYEQDIINQGFTVNTYNWSNNNATILRNHMINASQQTLGLFGAVLVGSLPYANFKNGSEIFPCDLYLMDLDGQWIDLDPSDTYFDNHVAGLGDIYPEIFIGRINPEPLNNLNHLSAYQNYFNRNHAYRNGSLTRPHSQLLYIDNDWSNIASAMYNDMTAYTNITMVSSNPTTTGTDYKNRLTQIYEFVHIMVHSFYYQHQFGTGGTGSEGIVTFTDILNLNTKALFYNLFACSAARYKEVNNMGTQYLFSNNTLALVGSTKTGGMWMNSYFYTPLNQGKVFGEAFRLWWWNPLHGPWDTVSQGMTILGDPLLTT